MPPVLCLYPVGCFHEDIYMCETLGRLYSCGLTVICFYLPLPTLEVQLQTCFGAEHQHIRHYDWTRPVCVCV